MSSWSQSFRRVFCCGLGAEDSTEEPTYDSVEELNQAHDTDAADTLSLVVEGMDEIRRMLAPIADVLDRMRRLEEHLHPLLVYRPEDQYMDMHIGPRPVLGARPPTSSVFQDWLQERIDYGEPW